MTIENEILSIKNQLVKILSPKSIILFGSQAKGIANYKSDIDLCIIANTDDKRATLIDAYMHVESTKPFDLILYTEEEWNAAENESSSFAHLIKKGGSVIYGG